ncbi:MAG: ATP:cob(I)alamin adenosyltransferase, partial [Gammaproteobacteria bacterium]|nr:ATP:cob(I)alamin adenosyltransferase [Gammaproteobacteria bacterium]
SNLHLARTVCRRVERNLVTLNDSEKVNTNSFTYLNRLSDLLFILTRYLAAESNIDEVYWQSEYSRIRPEK